MSLAGPIRNISDTALWVAVYRAQENERNDAVFRDPYARRLAGARGMQIAAEMPFAQRHSWSYTARTWLVDQVIEHEVQQGDILFLPLRFISGSTPVRFTSEYAVIRPELVLCCVEPSAFARKSPQIESNEMVGMADVHALKEHSSQDPILFAI